MPDGTPTEGRVVIAGASGLLGRGLSESLAADGIPVTWLVRREARTPDEVTWAPGERALAPEVLRGARAVVCLNGASIGRMPWTRRYQHELVWSRVSPTRTIAAALRELGDEAPLFAAASAAGYYPSVRGRIYDEMSPRGDTFLADLCGEWETAASAAGPRVAHLRTAPVIHPQGVLAPLITLTRLGVSGPIAGGRQVWPVVSYTDAVRALRFVVDRALTGPVNIVSPERTTANDLGFALARRMSKPYLVPAPGFALRAVLGKDATEGVLTVDSHVTPAVLTASGFTFDQPRVDDAIAAVIPPAN